MFMMTAFMYVIVIILSLAAKSVAGLQCYECVNVEIEQGASLILSGLIDKSNPSCGIDPRESTTCPADTNACGSLNGYIRQSSVFGELRAKVQVRGCVYDHTDGIGGCRKSSSVGNKIVGDLISAALESNIQVDGELCTCKIDMCTLCDGGIELGGYCFKYWMLGLSVGGLLLFLISLVTCCCCCCGCCGCCCCKKGQRGVVLSSAHPYQTLTFVHTVGSNPSGLSIQSGDISRFDNPMGPIGAVGGAPVDTEDYPPPYGPRTSTGMPWESSSKPLVV